jgi:hypothetical protein
MMETSEARHVKVSTMMPVRTGRSCTKYLNEISPHMIAGVMYRVIDLQITNYRHGQAFECGSTKALNETAREQGIIAIAACDANGRSNNCHNGSENKLGTFSKLSRKG